jgi:outer membrane lipoprotein-sorting protein
MQSVDGHMCAAKAIHFESFERDDRMVFYVNSATRQILGWDQVFGDMKMYFRFDDLRFDVNIPKEAFEWRPPAGFKERI